MSAYLIGTITVKAPALWTLYVEGVAKSLAPFDAELVFRGKRVAALAGDQPLELAVVIRFADQAALEAWFYSEDYQELIPLRDRAADVVITSYDEIE